MSCTIEFHESLTKAEFCIDGKNQKILLDMLTRHGNMDIKSISKNIDVPTTELQEIYNGNGCLTGEKSDALAQIFLIFFSKNFFKNCTLIRKYCN